MTMHARCFLLVLLLACTASASAQTLAIDTQKSQMTVHVYKAGMFSAFGHDHEIQAPIESGEINLGARTVQLTIDARKMKVVDPDLAADKRAEVQKTMDTQVLESARYNGIRFRSTSADPGANGSINVRGTLTLHGQTQAVMVEVRNSNGVYTGRSKFKQTAFGIKPVSVAGGTVKVRDEVLVEFQIATAK